MFVGRPMGSVLCPQLVCVLLLKLGGLLMCRFRLLMHRRGAAMHRSSFRVIRIGPNALLYRELRLLGRQRTLMFGKSVSPFDSSVPVVVLGHS
jgi:hypothetical protein